MESVKPPWLATMGERQEDPTLSVWRCAATKCRSYGTSARPIERLATASFICRPPGGRAWQDRFGEVNRGHGSARGDRGHVEELLDVHALHDGHGADGRGDDFSQGRNPSQLDIGVHG
jgi:hypothetical protein